MFLRTRRGMTFVEIMVGMLVFSIIFIGFMRALAFSKLQIMTTSETVAATKVLTEAMELMRSKPYSVIHGWGVVSNVNYEQLSADNLNSLDNLNAGVCRVTIQRYTEGSTTYQDGSIVTVRVLWNSVQGGQPHLQAVSFFTEGGLNDA